MIVPVLLVLGVAGAVYYLAREPVSSVGEEVVGADAAETTLEPYRVIVKPRGRASASFGDLFEYSPPSDTPIARVVVTGGKRWVPHWDKRGVIYDYPSRVEVYLKGETAPRTDPDVVEQVSVYGGTRASSSQALRPARRWFSWLRR